MEITGASTGRYFLVNEMAMQEDVNQELMIVTVDNRIELTLTGGGIIEQVTLFNTEGRQEFAESSINQTDYSFYHHQKGVYILRVQTDAGVIIRKIAVK